MYVVSITVTEIQVHSSDRKQTMSHESQGTLKLTMYAILSTFLVGHSTTDLTPQVMMRVKERYM